VNDGLRSTYGVTATHFNAYSVWRAMLRRSLCVLAGRRDARACAAERRNGYGTFSAFRALFRFSCLFSSHMDAVRMVAHDAHADAAIRHSTPANARQRAGSDRTRAGQNTAARRCIPIA